MAAELAVVPAAKAIEAAEAATTLAAAMAVEVEVAPGAAVAHTWGVPVPAGAERPAAGVNMGVINMATSPNSSNRIIGGRVGGRSSAAFRSKEEARAALAVDEKAEKEEARRAELDADDRREV